MRTAMMIGTGLILTVSAGCRTKEPAYATNDRVNVDVPFVNVHVGEEGGVKVRAPFTHVETPRYVEGQMVSQGVVQQPAVMQPAQNPAVYQQTPPLNQQAPPANSTQYQPLAPAPYNPGP